MRVVCILALFVLLLSPSTLSPTGAGAAEVEAPDWGVPGIHFFTQTGGVGGQGFLVMDDADARILATYYALGGDQQIGYPISNRYEMNGQVCQGFQRAIICWNKERGKAELVSIFDELSQMGQDSWLWDTYRVPGMVNPPVQTTEASPETVQAYQARLDADRAMKDFYFSAEDPVALFGLPMNDVIDAGDYMALRLQKAVFQRWKEDRPWASAGTVTVVLGGDMARIAGMIPPGAIGPLAPEEVLGGERWIDVNLTEQTATAYAGIKPLYVAVVATGVPGWETPKGDWRIFSRVENETMRGADYYLTGVLFTQYITSWGVALHYNYWTPEEEFGNRAGSHGCVGMRYDDSLFFWEFADIGTRVTIHD